MLFSHSLPLCAILSISFGTDLLKKIINVSKFPLTRLSSTTASEISKILENSYRAVNIAFIEEWARFTENVGEGTDVIAIVTTTDFSNMTAASFDAQAQKDYLRATWKGLLSKFTKLREENFHITNILIVAYSFV